MAKEKTKKIPFNLYNNTVEIIFYPKAHKYKKDGVYIPSVSSITGIIDKSSPLMYWSSQLSKNFLLDSWDRIQMINKKEFLPLVDEAVNQHRYKKEEAGAIGTEVHKWVENYINAKIENKEAVINIPKDKRVVNGAKAFLTWLKDNDVKFIDSEKFVYSKEYNFVGTLDCIAKVNGKLTLIDFKTSNNVHSEHFLQVAGYRGAYQEQEDVKIDNSFILHFSKETGEFNLYETTDYDKDYEAFLSCLNVKRRLKELKI